MAVAFYVLAAEIVGGGNEQGDGRLIWREISDFVLVAMSGEYFL